jgi:molybdopterin-guanine dinucleotide biosynthesis protein A
VTDFVGPFSGAVLTGGRSTRMGRDKALLESRGRPLAVVARDALIGAGAAEVLAVGGDGEAMARLGFRHVVDLWPGQGPLGGVVTALRAAVHEVVVVLACDLPDVAPAAVTAVLAALDSADAAIPDVDGRRQVLMAAYRRTCLVPLEAALDAGERALRDAVRRLAAAPVDLADPRWVRNVNVPGDLEEGSQGTPT